MLVHYQRNKQAAFYDSDQLQTAGRPEPPEPLRRPFISCGDCPYPSHGFQCYIAEGDLLRRAVLPRLQIQQYPSDHSGHG